MTTTTMARLAFLTTTAMARADFYHPQQHP
jgi:hypothetical protein